jgi:hypothetical protein
MLKTNDLARDEDASFKLMCKSLTITGSVGPYKEVRATFWAFYCIVLFGQLSLEKREPKCAKVVNFIRRSAIFGPILRLISLNAFYIM